MTKNEIEVGNNKALLDALMSCDIMASHDTARAAYLEEVAKAESVKRERLARLT